VRLITWTFDGPKFVLVFRYFDRRTWGYLQNSARAHFIECNGLLPCGSKISPLPCGAASGSQVRRDESALRIWDHFVVHHLKEVTESITEIEFAAFMLYRVATPLHGDPFAARVKLSSFSGPELYCLYRKLVRRYIAGMVVELEVVRASPYFRNIFTEIRKRLRETADSDNARPIWLADDDPLARCNYVLHYGSPGQSPHSRSGSHRSASSRSVTYSVADRRNSVRWSHR
jgi:hypothetical protein